MRDYATVAPQFWLGKTGRELRAAGAQAQVVAFYLMTSPHANMLGLYYLPVLYLAHETGLGLEGAAKGLKSAIEAGFCSYDDQTEMVWVHEMAAYQVGRGLKAGDNRCAGVRNEYASIPENPFLPGFFERYKGDFHLAVMRGSVVESEGASKGLRSQEQDQEQDQEQEQNTSGHGVATPPAEYLPDPGESVAAKKKNSYTHEFEEAWTIYPKRAGGNSKADAFKAWNARVKSGVTAQDMVAGVKRYGAYLAATGKLNTEYVQQAATFFGPSCHYENEWLIPNQSQYGGRNINQISPPDSAIPPGFRG
ncbi:DNA-binding protein [Lelliottia nimipressuralis]